MGKRIFHQVTVELDRLEREGYFVFARAGIKVADRLVHDHQPEELEAIGLRVADALKTPPGSTRRWTSIYDRNGGILQTVLRKMVG